IAATAMAKIRKNVIPRAIALREPLEGPARPDLPGVLRLQRGAGCLAEPAALRLAPAQARERRRPRARPRRLDQEGGLPVMQDLAQHRDVRAEDRLAVRHVLEGLHRRQPGEAADR